MQTQLSRRMSHIDTSEIRKLFDLAGKLQSPINLSIGQPHYPTPQPILDALEKALRDGRTAYTQTQGIAPLRERLAVRFRERNHFTVDPDKILISSGIASLLQLLFLAAIDPGDKIVTTDPCFLIYRSLASFMGAELITIPEQFQRADIEALHDQKIKMILFSSPSNPSGYVQSRDSIALLGELAEKSGALLVSDEIYEIFDYSGKFTSAAAVYNRAVTLFGFSKAWSMTGLRLAAVTGPADLIEAMTTLQQYSVVCAPTPVQWAGIAALDLDMSSYVEDYRHKRDYLCDALGDQIEESRPDGAFYLYIDCKEDSRDFIRRAIDTQELLVVPGHIFGSSKSHIRISYGVDEPTLKRGARALQELLKR